MYVTITSIKEVRRRTGNGFLISTIITCDEFGNKELSGWKGKHNFNWKVGNRVDISVSKKKSKDNKITFYNYKPVDSIGPEVKSQKVIKSENQKTFLSDKSKKYIMEMGLNIEEIIQLGILVARILTLQDKKRMYSGIGWLTKQPLKELVSYGG